MSAIAFAPPRTGWIRGNYDQARVDLTFDRPGATVRGEVEQAPVNLQTDHDRATITGQSHGKPVDLTFQWSPQHVHYEGRANGTEVNYDVDYTTHTVEGHMGKSNIDVRFDEQAGIISGEAGGVVDLKLSNDGHLRGVMCGRSMDADMQNIDMGQMLSNIFLFAPEK